MVLSLKRDRELVVEQFAGRQHDSRHRRPHQVASSQFQSSFEARKTAMKPHGMYSMWTGVDVDESELPNGSIKESCAGGS